MRSKVVILGVGYKTTLGFQPKESVYGTEHAKVNIGAACARQLAAAGHDLIIIARTQDRIDKVKEDLLALYPDRKIEARALDALNAEEVSGFFASLDSDCHYDYVHSAGLGAGAYRIKDDNPYLPFEEIPIDLPCKEYEAVVKSLFSFVNGFLPFFRRQERSKVVVVNSMSGIRPYSYGFSHSAAKAGLHNAVKSLTLEFCKEHIYFSEVNPGMVDTGAYDGQSVIDSVQKISEEFGYHYDELPQMSPYAVGDAVKLCLESEAHLLELNLVAEGQFPHSGA